MPNYICNPMNLPYRYQLIEQSDKSVSRSREAADPSVVVFGGKYCLFPSMSRGYFLSENLTDWDYHPTNELPVYDYAPTVRVVGEYLYFCASKRSGVCDFYRTKDIESGIFEKIEGSFPFWDPDLFLDDDGRLYLYWGCTNTDPLYGVELDRDTLKPLTEPTILIEMQPDTIGYERNGENHDIATTRGSINVLEQLRKRVGQQIGEAAASQLSQERLLSLLPQELRGMVGAMLSGAPYYEGAWMTKHNGTYYLQYAVPGTQYNVYCDGVYESKSPLEGFVLAKNNPYSYQPQGFITGAGHGSTFEGIAGGLWHCSTMRISINHSFERRLGLWKAGFDIDGELFCNQRYGDWISDTDNTDPFAEPRWMLLSYGKSACASSGQDSAGNISDESIRSWWRAESSNPGEWVELDLGAAYEIHGIQVNFADETHEGITIPDGTDAQATEQGWRYIDETMHKTQWVLEGSSDGGSYFVIEDKREATTDLPHDLVICEEGFRARYIRLTVVAVPYGVAPCVSGLRVFGLGRGVKPDKVGVLTADRDGTQDFSARWAKIDSAVGYNLLWGHTPEKLYHSCLVLGSTQQRIGALIAEQEVYLRVDAFNECGITQGDVIKL